MPLSAGELLQNKIVSFGVGAGLWDVAGDYALTRLVFQRGIGLVYLIAFLCALNQFCPLLGEHGLLAVPAFLRQVSFRDAPSLFFLAPKDWAFKAAAWCGIVLSCSVIGGIADAYSSWMNALIWFLIWVLYLSFVNVGQIFYGFGWESILLEAGFLSMFLGGRGVQTPLPVIWLLRWLEFRIMFGAGLIKLRGDACWRDLTCLDYHYETQPIPNPLSWYLHFAPQWTHRAGVVFNHFSELLAPFLYFLPQPFASIGAAVTILFQGFIFASGNLSWLNFMTMILAVPAIDGRYLDLLNPLKHPLTGQALSAPVPSFKFVVLVLFAGAAWLSINPIRNMLSPGQVMNTSYDPLHLMGSYGAFGSISQQRFEVVVEGTGDPVITDDTRWKEYEFKGKPNDVNRLPPQIAPYHLRLDWLMWFAAMSSYNQHPWFVNFMAKLLENDAPVLSLLKSNPFPDRAPHFVRAELYQYHFASPERRRQTGQWWVRTPVGHYFPAVSLENPSFRAVLLRQGWL